MANEDHATAGAETPLRQRLYAAVFSGLGVAVLVAVVAITTVGFGARFADEWILAKMEVASSYLPNASGKCIWIVDVPEPTLPTGPLLRTTTGKSLAEAAAPPEAQVKAAPGKAEAQEAGKTRAPPDTAKERKYDGPQLCLVQVTEKRNPVLTNVPHEQVYRVAEQLVEVKNRALHHSFLASFFYRQYFISLSVASVAWLVAAISFFFVSRQGWAQSRPPLVTLCVVAVATGALFSALPRVFEHEKNIAENQTLYLAYVALDHEMRSWMVTGSTGAKDNPKPDAVRYILVVDARLRELNAVKVAFDPKSLIELQKQLQIIDTEGK